jgi:hypothetical protein
MAPEQVQESSDRDQLWASLRALRPEIDLLAAGLFDASDRQRHLVRLLARAVAVELSLEAREGTAAEDAATWELPAWVRRDCEPHRGRCSAGWGSSACLRASPPFSLCPA